MTEPHWSLPVVPYLPGSLIVAGLWGLTLASAFGSGEAPVEGLPPLGDISFPAGLVLAAWILRGTAVSVTVRHVHAVDGDTVRPLAERVCEEARHIARLMRDDEITAERKRAG